MIKQYDRSRKLEWIPEACDAWGTLRGAIRNCQTLHFPDPTAPVYLHTDAFDYGIGAYLFQLIDGEEVCIALLSKTLTEAESRWSVTEKECYAFVYAFKKLEYLLRGRRSLHVAY